MTMLKQAGEHRDALCRMMFPLNPPIFYHSGHFRAIGFSAAVFIQFPSQKAAQDSSSCQCPRAQDLWVGGCSFQGVEGYRSSLLQQGSVPGLLPAQSSLTGWEQDRILLPHFVPFWTSQRGWGNGRNFPGGFLASLVEEGTFKAMISPGKQNLSGVKAFQKGWNSKRLFSAFQSLYKPSLVLSDITEGWGFAAGWGCDPQNLKWK